MSGSDEHISKAKELQESAKKNIIEKLNNGTKRVACYLPNGCGKTQLLIDIAKELCIDSVNGALFICKNIYLRDQMAQKLGENPLRNMIMTFYDFKKEYKIILQNKKYVFVDDVDELFISQNRELSNMLEDFNGTVISVMSIPPWLREIQ